MIEDQALDRVYRIGQTKPVTTVRYTINGTLEEVSISLLGYGASTKSAALSQLPIQVTDTPLFKSIRHQQKEKRNLAEQAFRMVQRGDNWLNVSFFSPRLLKMHVTMDQLFFEHDNSGCRT